MTKEFAFLLVTFKEGGVRFTINTDGTYLCRTNLMNESRRLTESDINTSEDAERCRQLAWEVSFLEQR